MLLCGPLNTQEAPPAPVPQEDDVVTYTNRIAHSWAPIAWAAVKLRAWGHFRWRILLQIFEWKVVR